LFKELTVIFLLGHECTIAAIGLVIVGELNCFLCTWGHQWSVIWSRKCCRVHISQV